MATIVLTGGNRGIGLELAKLYEAVGDTVIMGLRNPAAASAPNVETLRLDVREDSSVQQFAEALDDRPVDILINNAGIIGPDIQSTMDMNFDGFLDALNVNTLGPLRMTQALLPNLQRARAAKLAVITSRMGSLSYAKSDRVAYRTSKAAANKVTQCLATDLVASGIPVAAIHPGWVKTDMGGPDADIDAITSARGIKSVIDALSLKDTGRFWNYDGNAIEW